MDLSDTELRVTEALFHAVNTKIGLRVERSRYKKRGP